MKRITVFLGYGIFMIALLVSCQQDFVETTTDVNVQKSVLDNYVLRTIKESNEPFDWNVQDNETFYKALTITDNIVVIGYTDGLSKNINLRNDILSKVYQWENKKTEQLGEIDDVLKYKDDVLGFISVEISSFETLQKIRALSNIQYTEVNAYPIELDIIGAFNESYVSNNSTINYKASQTNTRRDVILDPYLDAPDYPEQVEAYDPTFGTIIRRHNLDKVYRQYQVYGEGIGVAVIDNGIVPWAQDLFEENGYGERGTLGYYKPLWFLPWATDDGISPVESDVLGIAAAFEGQWLHGSGMIQSALVISPSSNMTSVRASNAIYILVPSHIYGISSAIRDMANRDDIRIINMSMGTIQYIHRIKTAINLYHSKGKIMGSAAGTSFKEIKDLLDVIFPAWLPQTVAVTGIDNRETTNGEFITGETAHSGEKVDFCVEKSAASSEATARMVGMFTVLWSANPDLTREELMDVMIQSSHFYETTGQKDSEFGWGTVDMLKAVEMVLE